MLATHEEMKTSVEDSAAVVSITENENIGVWVKHDDGAKRTFRLSDLLEPLPATFPVDLLSEVFKHAAMIVANQEHHVVITSLRALGYNINQYNMAHFYNINAQRTRASLTADLLVIFDQQELLQKSWQSTSSDDYKPTLALFSLALKSSNLAMAQMILQRVPEDEEAQFVETKTAPNVLYDLCNAEFDEQENDELVAFAQTLIDLGVVVDLEDQNHDSPLALAARNNPALSALFAKNLKLAADDYDRAMRLLKTAVYEGDVGIVEAVLSQTRFNEYEAIMNGNGGLYDPHRGRFPGGINIGRCYYGARQIEATADDYAGVPTSYDSFSYSTRTTKNREVILGVKHHVLRNLNYKHYITAFPALFVALSKAHDEKYQRIVELLLQHGSRITTFSLTVYTNYSDYHVGFEYIWLTDVIVSTGCLSMMYVLKEAGRLDRTTASVLDKYPVLFQDTVAEPQSVLDRLQNVIRKSCVKYIIAKTYEKTNKMGVVQESDGIKRAYDFFCDAASVCSSEQLPVLYYYIAKQLEISFKRSKTSGLNEGSFMAELVDGLASEPHMSRLFGVQYQAKRADRKQNLKLIRQFCLQQSQNVDLSLNDDYAESCGSLRPSSGGSNGKN